MENEKLIKYKCEFCNKEYKRKGNLNNHMKNKHKDEKMKDYENINKEDDNIVIVNNVLPEEVKEYKVKKIEKLHIGNNLDILKDIKNDSVDIVITSPPYDDLRTYKGNFKIDLIKLGKELYRVLKDGGIYAMVIQDQTINFGKTLTSFRTAINHVDEIGFKLFETCIYQKLGCEGAWWKRRFRVDHEYIHIFLKGKRPAYFDKEPIKIPSKHGGKTMTGCATRKTDGTTFKSKSVTINELKCPGTIWNYANGGDKNKLKRKHPAVFPDKIPYDLIQVFCPKDGVVLDPMCGSGSTIIQAKKLNRGFIGIDIEEEYINITKERLEQECQIKI